jgi:hypothetical protein
MSTPAWRKSSYSGGSSGQSDCVELAALPGRIGIRDSKNPDGGTLTVSAENLGRLVTRIKAGELEL